MQQPDSRWNQAGDAEPPSSKIIPFLLMVVVSVALCAIGYFAFSFQKQQIKQDNADQLSAIASLKIEQITTWLEERKGDAFALSHHSRFAELMEEYRKNGALAEHQKQWLLERLKTIQKAYHYDGISLHDRNGKEFLSLTTAATPDHHDAGLPIAAIREQSLQLSDFHLAEDGKPELDLSVPLRTGGKKAESVSGALQLRIDPNQFLFPFIQFWPTPSKTGETLLVRREGDSILYLNELRHYPGSAMKLYRSIDSRIPAARALQGESGSISGVDYRGKAVITHARSVPGTPWVLVVKVDEEEIYAPIHRIGLYVSLAVLLLITFANVALFFWWRQRRARFVARHAQALLEKKVLAQHFDYLSKYANDIIVLTDRDGRIVEANDRALEAYGYTREEFLGTSAATLRASEARDKFTDDWQKLHEQGRVLYETLHQRKDGTTFPVEISLREFESDGQTFVQAVIRDITERKQAEQALQASEKRHRLLLHNFPAGVVIHAADTRVVYSNPQAALLLGLSEDQMQWKTAIDPAWHFLHRDGSIMSVEEYPVARVIASGQPLLDYVVGIQRPDRDQPLWLLVHAYPEAEQQNIVVMFVDITTRIAAEAELLDARNHYLNILEHAPALIWRSGTDAKCDWFNATWLEFTGRQMAEECGDGWAEGVHPDDLERCTASYLEAFQVRRPFEIEYRLRRFDGEFRWIVDYGRPLYSPQGEFGGYIGYCFDLTPRKQAEQALAESARFANATIDALSAHLCVLDETGCIVAVNQAWRDFAQENHGASSSDYLGANYLAVCDMAAGTSSEGAAEFAEGVRAVMRGDIPESCQEYPCHSPDERRWFAARVSRFGGDGPLRIVAVHENITARKLAEEALLRYQEHLEDAVATRTASLQESEERVRLILESSGEGIFGVDLEGRITFVNPAACKILGYTTEQLLGADSHATFHHTRLDGVPYPVHECPRNRAYQEGVASQVYGEVFWSRDGLAIPVEYAATPLCKGSELIGAVVSFRDISERKAAEAKLLSREQFLRTITDTVPGMVGYWSADLTCQFANKAYWEWFGKRPDEMLGMPIRELFGEKLFHINEPYIRKVLAGEEQHFERTLIKATGESAHTWAHYIPDVMDGRVRGFFVLVSDVTELKQAQEKLELTNRALQVRSEEAEAAARAKGAFLANMSHELRTPLHAVIGFSRLMANDASFSEPQKRNLEIIHHAGNHLLSLIDDILEYSKTDAGHMLLAPANAYLEGLLREVKGMLEARAKEAGLTLMLETTNLPACVSIDAPKLRQILINLLTNAIKYTKQGGAVLAVTGVELEDNQVELDFAVSDTGIGIAGESLESIFEPFIQAAPSSRQSGTGLGLSISRQYVRLMGGELTVESVPGKGSTFRFALKVPRIDMLDGAMQHLAHGRLRAIGLSRRVLLVDDDDDGRSELKELLERLGCMVMEADGAAAAESCLGQFQPELIFMDWQMPGIDGIEATRRIRARTDIKQPIVVMITAYSFEEHEKAALSAGIDAFIGKPINVDKIYESLKHWLSMESVPSTPSDDTFIEELAPGKLESLPAEVRERLTQAVIELNPEKISAAIAPLETIQPETYRHLKTLVDALQYGRLGRLLGIDGFEEM